MTELSPLLMLSFTSVLALLPVIIGVGTSYIKISIVLGMLKSGLGTQNVPGSMVVMTLSVALSVFVMTPVCKQSLEKLDTELNLALTTNPASLEKLAPALEPWCLFMKKHASAEEVSLFQILRGDSKEKSEDSLPCLSSVGVFMPAFVISELKEAFAMAFTLLLPFLVVDLVVANILVGLGMFMVSPVMIALPLKLLLFVLSDGWILITKGLVLSYV